MKLRSIALAGLLGVGLLTTTGCFDEDDVIEALKLNVIYTTNGTASPVLFKVNSDEETVDAKEFFGFTMGGSNSYSVSYNGSSETSLTHGGIYNYVATTCHADGYLSHQANATKAHVVNLTGGPLNANAIVVRPKGTTGSSDVTSSEIAGNCAITGISAFNNVVIENDMNVSTDGGSTWTTITGIDADYIAIANNLKFDIVVFGTNDITLVPMAGYDELLDIAANQP